MKNLRIKTAREASSVFEGMVLSQGNLYSFGNKKTPLMTGVERVSVGNKFNKIILLDGSVYTYTPDWELLSFGGAHSAVLGDFFVSSNAEISQDEDFHLVKGEALKIVDKYGMVLHDNVLGFMPINERFHIVRRADKRWALCTSDGGVSRFLTKANVVASGRKFMFDERGKMRMNMHDAFYCDVLNFD